ncbi:MAG: hypothetical protein Q9220_007561 [cf. Caloplaca sp. 1 TL-2023]
MSKVLLSKINSTFIDRSVPTQIILPIFSNYVISGPESITAYFKDSKDLSTTSRSLAVLVNAFGCPNHLAYLFEPQKPSTGPSIIVDENIEQLIHRAVQTGLSSAHLDALTTRYQKSLAAAIDADPTFDTGSNWTELRDLNAFVERRVFDAAVQSMFGTYMLSLNSTLSDDFWTFNRAIGTLFMGLPQFLSPAAYRARDKMLQNIKRWQRHGKEHCEITQLDDVGWEPCFGSKFIRERQILLDKRGITDETARAAENFAFMWATAANSVPAATWFLYEVLQDSQLRSRVYTIIPSAKRKGPNDNNGIFDTSKLCSDPLLQSLYAETLRLRVAVLVVREPARDNFSFRGWHIKKNEVLSVSTRTEAMNTDIWSTGSDGDAQPLDTMWADRFIIHPKTPGSGPLRLPREKRRKPPDRQVEAGGKPYFSMDGLSASWIPYGGGKSLCPGRHFAKQEIITTAAILLTTYDLELIDVEGKNAPRYSKKGKTYLLPDFSGKPIFILPPSQLKWLIDQPDHILSTPAFHYDAQQGDYAFTHPRILGDPYHEHVLHKSLPRKIGALVPDLWDEVVHTFDQVWGTDTTRFKEVDVHESVDHLVAPAVNRMLVGLPLCRNEAYLAEMYKFTMNAVTMMTVLQFVPSFLAPLVGRLLAIPIRTRLKNTRRYTLPIINERLAAFRRDLNSPSDPEIKRWQPPNDYLTWHITLAHAENRLDELDPDIIARRLLALNFAALHTTAMGSINCLLDLIASDPAEGYMAAIREEAVAALAFCSSSTTSSSPISGESGSKNIWTKAALNSCHLADSALRESLRVSNFMSRNVQKKVLAPTGLVNPVEGWRAERGSYLAVDMHNPQHDPLIYPDPENYRAFRFASLSSPSSSQRQDSVSSSSHASSSPDSSNTSEGQTSTPTTTKPTTNTSTLTTSPTFLPFGHGRHACPGRFFIAVEIKLMLAYMAMNYDIEPLAERPRNRWLGGIRLPPTKAVIKVRRRR